MEATTSPPAGSNSHCRMTCSVSSEPVKEIKRVTKMVPSFPNNFSCQKLHLRCTWKKKTLQPS
ncbi:unnamed protein product [Clavelina lepadiformis]|uniref:Uncharacterized protein n=1 Tax=Clavelina lepadiformis TaxID=159417 RepID=A0ABP0FRB7_CLALP